MADRAVRAAWAFGAGVAVFVVLTRHFVTHDADWFTYLGVPTAAAFLWQSISA